MKYNENHSKKSKKSLDGFIQGDASRSDFESRFRTSYQPGFQRKASTTEEKIRASDTFAPRVRRPASFDAPSFTGASITESTSDEPQKRRPFTRNQAEKHGRKKRTKFKKVVRGFAVMTIALVIGVSSLFAYGFIKARGIFKGNGDGAAALQKNVDPAKLNGEGDGRVNILLIGRGGEGHEAPDLTDTLLLASIDPVQNEASLVSVPRDLYVKDRSGYSSKINAVYANTKQAYLADSNDTDGDKENAENAGIDALEDVVSDVLGVPIHYYAMVDFKAFEEAINTVGGITVDVKEPLYDETIAWKLDGNPLIADEGLQTFDGERALYYARSRKGSARGDFDRTERQREIIVALQKKLLSAGTFSNPFKVIELLNTLGSHVRTDLNGTDEIKRLYEIGQNIGGDRIGSIGLADAPNILVTTDYVGDQSVVVPVEGLYQYDDIRSFIRNNMRDAFLKSEDAKVVILNGTTVAGFATARAEELRSYGYNVVDVANAPTSDYSTSYLIDNTGGVKRYTRSYLEKRLGMTVTNTAIAGIPGVDEADFVILLGTDETTKTNN